MAKDPLNTLGATNHSEKERSKLDYYGTDPEAVRRLLENEAFSHSVWEPTAGHNNIVEVLRDAWYSVVASDVFDYGYGNVVLDFLKRPDAPAVDMDIVMNPPYKEADEFVIKALRILAPGHKLAAFLRLQFLEGQRRYERIFRDNPPTRVYAFVKRQVCSKTDDFSEGSAVAYAWFVWEKGFKGHPEIRWIS